MVRPEHCSRDEVVVADSELSLRSIIEFIFEELQICKTF